MRSNISKLKMKAVQMIARKSHLEKRIQRLQEELMSTIQSLDGLVKFIAEQEEEKVNAPSA